MGMGRFVNLLTESRCSKDGIDLCDNTHSNNGKHRRSSTWLTGLLYMHACFFARQLYGLQSFAVFVFFFFYFGFFVCVCFLLFFGLFGCLLFLWILQFRFCFLVILFAFFIFLFYYFFIFFWGGLLIFLTFRLF